ncbi:SAF domain-containing protein [Bifidobacterium aemilianum]|uniref:SAF domain-containing protein n=1 Tax=Bifidobacterium aemilianum TaxID=2493120 RepID=UPI001374DDA4|nr:SAF domain-containing protein [Bifidobacterium aemilianum]
MWLLLRLGAIVSLSLCLFFILEALAPTQHEQAVVVAAKTLAQGQRIDRTSLNLTSIPSSTALVGSFSSTDQIEGKIAQVGIARGQIILAPMAGPGPTLPIGFTMVEAPIAGSVGHLLPGDRIALLSSAICSQDGTPETSGSSERTAANRLLTGVEWKRAWSGQSPMTGLNIPTLEAANQPCTLAAEAIVMEKPGKTGRADAAASLLCAMPAQEALKVIGAQEVGAIVAVKLDAPKASTGNQSGLLPPDESSNQHSTG